MIEVETFQAGKYVQNGKFRCFVPSLVNDEWTWQSRKINSLLASASNALGELKGLSLIAPSVDLFITLFATKEATASSRIEGTRTELDEAIKPESEVLPERRDDWDEVQNYVAALEEARAAPLPVSSRMIRRAHNTLMRGVRGQNKAPGEFRRVQNYLSATSVSEIFYPPPAPKVAALMSDLEKFLHNPRIDAPALIRIAVAHYQFETIHPFLDGNGRIGRLIVPMHLAEQGVIGKPLLYMSRYLEQNKMRYYENLTRARGSDIARWLEYFLTGIRESAKDGVRVLAATLDLQKTATEKVRKEFKRGGKGLSLLEHLFAHPFIGVEAVVRKYGLTYAAANALVGKMVKIGLLRETTGQSRNRLFVFREYLDIFE